MYNDFIIVGPKSDPARIRGMKNVAAAMAKIAADHATFLSRGDDSDTNIKKLALWKDAHVDPKSASGNWYKETGSDMGETLNTTSAMNGYTLADRATWIRFKNKGDLTILVEGDPRLFNQYGVMPVNPTWCPKARTDLARKFENWLLPPQGNSWSRRIDSMDTSCSKPGREVVGVAVARQRSVRRLRRGYWLWSLRGFKRWRRSRDARQT